MAGNQLTWIARAFGDPNFVPLVIDDLEILREIAIEVRAGSGTRLYVEGSQAEACYLIRSGTVHLVRNNGKTEINLATMGSGQMIGDNAMFAGSTHMATAVARTAVVALEMERAPTMAALATRPRIGLRWMVEALRRSDEAYERMAVVLQGSVASKVAAYLAGHDGGSRIDITQDALASVIGAERASVSRAISQLKDNGAITNSRGSIHIVDRAALIRIRDS